jgi:RNA polymerase sigma-70 factor (ECF subfamily)
MSDYALIARIKSRDREALADFIALREPHLLAFIGKRMSDGLKRKVEPGDILQELTVSAFAALDDVELGDRDPFSWLCQLAERRIIDAHRHHFGAQKRDAGREVNLGAPRGGDADGAGLEPLLAASMTSPSRAFSRQQKEFHVLEALDGLGDDAKEALKLRYLQGLPSKEIAQRLGKSDGAVRVLLSRALVKLQEALAHNSEFQTLLANAQRPDRENS